MIRSPIVLTLVIAQLACSITLDDEGCDAVNKGRSLNEQIEEAKTHVESTKKAYEKAQEALNILEQQQKTAFASDSGAEGTTPLATESGSTMEKGADAVDCQTPEEATAPKERCDVDAYYANVDLEDVLALHTRINHTNFLLYGTQDETAPEFKCVDVWKSLDFLDENAVEHDKVDLLYSKDPMAKTEKSNSRWNREHTWPKSYGVSCKTKKKMWSNTRKGVKCKTRKNYDDRNGPFTDLHHLFPSNTNVNSDRSSQYFDKCTDRTCTYDAHPENGYTESDKDAGESLDDKTFWQPPKKSRGVVARALFYMALRYDGEEKNTFDLTLADNPAYCEDAMGRLSVLKEWHEEFPPTPEEKERNNKVCWIQGNRNPFVDHPELVAKLFGDNASPKLVKTDPEWCDSTSPRAKMCDPDAPVVNECTEELRPVPRN